MVRHVRTNYDVKIEKKRKQQQQLIIIINNNKCDETLAEARVKDFVRATRNEYFFFFLFLGMAIGFH